MLIYLNCGCHIVLVGDSPGGGQMSANPHCPSTVVRAGSVLPGNFLAFFRQRTAIVKRHRALADPAASFEREREREREREEHSRSHPSFAFPSPPLTFPIYHSLFCPFPILLCPFFLSVQFSCLSREKSSYCSHYEASVGTGRTKHTAAQQGRWNCFDEIDQWSPFRSWRFITRPGAHADNIHAVTLVRMT